MKWIAVIPTLTLGKTIPCDCQCCGVEENTAALTWSCAVFENKNVNRPFRNQGPNCKGFCQKPKDDVILQSALDELDWQRFCFYECAPLHQSQGALCVNIDQKKAKEKHEKSGNGRTTLDHVAFTRRHDATDSNDINPKDDWGSVMSKDASKIKVQAHKIADVAYTDMDHASKLKDESTAIFLKNKNVIPILVADVKETADAAREAFEIQLATEKLRDEIKEAAEEAAESVVKPTLREIRNKAEKRMKAEGKKEADLVAKKIKEDAPKAGVAAAKPWEDAMVRAQKVAIQYIKAGDGLSSASIGLKGQAKLISDGANLMSSLGNVGQSAKDLVNAYTTMDLAKSLHGAATGMYNKANGIVSTLKDYITEARMAAWHAERMIDPEALPPPVQLPLPDPGPPNYNVRSAFNDPAIPQELTPYDPAASQSMNVMGAPASRDGMLPAPPDVPPLY